MGHVNKQQDELDAVTGHLLAEFISYFRKVNAEYSSQERDLGAVGEAVNFWRKAKKVKAAVIDGVNTAGWRESLRVVLLEVIAHAFLLLFDLDKQANEELTIQVKQYEDARDALVPNCGHPRCIEHPKVPYSKLGDMEKYLYQEDMDEVGNAADSG